MIVNIICHYYFLEFYYLLVNYDDNDDFYGWINRSLYKDLDKDGSPVVMNIEMNHEGKMIMRLQYDGNDDDMLLKMI